MMEQILFEEVSDPVFKEYLIENRKKWLEIIRKTDHRSDKFIVAELFVDYPPYCIGNMVLANYLRMYHGARVVVLTAGPHAEANGLLAQSFCADVVLPFNEDLQTDPGVDFRKMAMLPPEALRRWVLSLEVNGVLIGDLIYDTYLRATGLGSIEHMDKNLALAIRRAVGYVGFFEQLFSITPVLATAQGHMTFSSYGVMARVALKSGARVYSRKPGSGPITVRMYRRRDEMKIEEQTFSDAEMDFVRRFKGKEAAAFGHKFMVERCKGQAEHFDNLQTSAFLGNVNISKEEFTELLCLDRAKPTVCIMSHVMPDAPNVWPWALYEDYKIWLLRTLEIAKECPDTNWVVKPHPEAHHYVQAESTESLAEPYVRDCSNIAFWPDGVSSSSVPDVISAIVTVGGTVGIEFSALGIPVVVCAKNNYSHFCSAALPTTDEEYAEILKTINTLPPPSSEAVARARTLLYMMAKAGVVTCDLLPEMPKVIFDPWDSDTVWADALQRVFRFDPSDDPFYRCFKRQLEDGLLHTLNFDILDGPFRAKVFEADQCMEGGDLDGAILAIGEVLEMDFNRDLYFKMLRILILLGRDDEILCDAEKFGVTGDGEFAGATDAGFFIHRKKGIENGVPGLFINALPKSGSTAVLNALSEGLDIPICYISPHLFPRDVCIQPWVEELARGGAVARAHMGATGKNLASLRAGGLEKAVVLLRDPRQAVLSWSHYVTRFAKEGNGLECAVHDIPEGYLEMNRERRLDWMLDHHYPASVDWISGWLEAAGGGNGPEILFVHFEDFVNGPEAFFRSILTFLGAPADAPHVKAILDKTRKVNFRKGLTEEWREIFTPAQKVKAAGRLPKGLRDRFGWGD